MKNFTSSKPASNVQIALIASAFFAAIMLLNYIAFNA